LLNFDLRIFYLFFFLVFLIFVLVIDLRTMIKCVTINYYNTKNVSNYFLHELIIIIDSCLFFFYIFLRGLFYIISVKFNTIKKRNKNKIHYYLYRRSLNGLVQCQTTGTVSIISEWCQQNHR
jgi:hypothetical protein